LFHILDASDNNFLAKAQARVFQWCEENSAVQPEVCVAKGMPNGCDSSTRCIVEAALTMAFENPNSCVL
jgi:hypothetical protein